MKPPRSVATDIRTIIRETRPRLMGLSEEHVAEKPYPDKWSLKEILGHLIDSASTNHQRIVRMQEHPDIGKLGYEQLHWVNSQSYQTEPWSDIVNLWTSYNIHLAHVVEHVDSGSLANVCDIDYPKLATLEYVINDYVRHMRHHLGQIFSGADPRKRAEWKEGS